MAKIVPEPKVYSGKKKSSGRKKLYMLVVVVVLGGGGFTMYEHSKHTGTKPWAWKGEDWKNWLTFTKGEAKEGGQKLAEGTSKGWKWMGQKTQKLFDSSKELLARLGKDDAEEVPTTGGTTTGSEGTTTGGTTTGGTTTGGTTTGGTTKPKPSAVPAEDAALEAQSDNYKYGKEWLAKGLNEWKVSLEQPGAADEAKKHFEKAVATLTSALAELPGEKAVDELLARAKEYLADTEERIALIKKGD